MAKRITLAILILFSALVVLDLCVDIYLKHNSWVGGTYTLELDSINGKIKIPKIYKDLNISTYYDLIDNPADIGMRDKLIKFKLQNPQNLILIDSTNVRNQIFIYPPTKFIELNENSKKTIVETYKKNAPENLPYDLTANYIDSWLGKKEDMKFIKIKFLIRSSINDETSYTYIYFLSVNNISFAIQFQSLLDNDPDIFIENLSIKRKSNKNIT